jgi:hypothetical protein
MSEKQNIAIEYIASKAEKIPMRVRRVGAFTGGIVLTGAAIVGGGHALEKGANVIQDVFYDKVTDSRILDNDGTFMPGTEQTPVPIDEVQIEEGHTGVAPE